MKPCGRHRNGESGAALIAALAILILFALMGTAYMGFAAASLESSRHNAQANQARHMAEGGIRSAAAAVQAALAAGEEVPGSLELTLPGDLRSAAQDIENGRAGKVTVAISDETAKVNINHVPPRVLSVLLNVDGPTARKIRSSLPRGSAEDAEGERWLATVDDLLTRGLVPPEAFARIDKEKLTVYSVANPREPSSFINVNAIPPEALAAVVGLSDESAAALAAGRPYGTAVDFVIAAGKPAAMFNMPPPADAPESLPEAFCLKSRCYRLRAKASYTRHSLATPVTRYAEAVVYFPADGTPQYLFWSEAAPEEADEAEQEEMPEEPAEQVQQTEAAESAAQTAE